MKKMLGFKGRAKVAVIDHLGREVKSFPWQKNLLLDTGMNAIGTELICDIFNVAIKGHGDLATTEVVAGSNSYTLAAGVVTRTAGTRDFTSDDVGKWLGLASDLNQGGQITVLNSATSVDINNDTDAFVAQDITLLGISQVDMDDEYGVDRPAVIYSKPLGDETMTASGSAFNPTDVGRAVYIDGKRAFEITAYTSATVVEVDISGTDEAIVGEGGRIYDIRNDELGSASRTSTYGTNSNDNSTTTAGNVRTFKRTFIFDPEPELLEDIGNTNTYSRSGTTVTRTAGTRDFTADDVGKVLYFDSSEVESEIVAFTDATHVTVADSGTLAAQNARLYGFNTYEEIGFANSEFPTEINIRVALASPVDVLGPTSIYPGRQLKVVYEFTLTIEPDTSTSGNLSPLITGGTGMNANQSGLYAIESFSTSTINSDGGTNDDFTLLDPATPGFLGLSTNADALDPLGDKVRSTNTVFVPMEAEDYNGSYTRRYTGVFGLNDAIGTTWRTLFLGDEDTNIAVFTFRFTNNQTKDGTHVYSQSIIKSWGRDFS
jgi:hypothetical protein